MTRILKLELKGFKSFANKTDLVFGDKFNCVLGPNGSGKSNILDAICFVLGKSSAKGLRAEKSANLIYNGGKTKNPAKNGEVGIVFSNDENEFGMDAKTVTLTRIIHQTGQSTYKINGKTLTRQQVLEVMSRARIDPDGYNIILQGDIVQLVEMSPIERRQIVEEIAGLKVYEEKKEKTMNELQRVDEKLNEAGIILAERETHLKELKTERDQALKFRRLDEDLKRNKATIIHRKITAKQKDASGVFDQIKALQDKIDTARKDIAAREDQIRKLKLDIEKINREVEQKGEREQVLLHKEVEQLKVSIAVNKQRISTLDTELQKIISRKQDFTISTTEIEKKVASITANVMTAKARILTKEKQASELEARIKEFKKKHQIDESADVDKQVQELDTKIDAIQNEAQQLREQQQNQLREKDRLELIIQSHDDKITKVSQVEKENKQALDKLKQQKEEFKKATADLAKLVSDDNSAMAQLNTAREAYYAKREELAKLQAERARYSESSAGGQAVQKILALRNTNPKIYGTVAELGKVSSTYSLALEIAAGQRLQNIVVEDDKTAADCIKMLKQEQLGVATFLPLSKIKPPVIDTSLRKIQGAKGMALDLVTHETKFKSIFEFVLGNTIVVDDIDTTRKIGIGKARMVTMTGDLVEPSGSMTGGHRVQRRGMGFIEQDVSGKIEKLEAEIADKQTVISALEARRKDFEERIARLRELKHTLEGEIIKEEKALHLDTADLEASRVQKKKIQDELKEIETELRNIQSKLIIKNRDLAGAKTERQKLRDQITAMRNPRVLAELNSFEDKRRELKDEIMTVQGEIRSMESESTNILKPELEKTQSILKQHDKELQGFQKEKIALDSLIKTQDKELISKEKAEKEFYAQFKDLFQKRSKISDQVTKLEAENNAKSGSIREVENKSNAFALENAKTKAELAGLEEEYKPYMGLELFETKKDETIKREISEFEKMMQDLGAVNMKALDIYEEVEKSYHELMGKKSSLQKEREDVLVMINEIDSKKQELFIKTFDVLNEHFKTIFGRLSTKGDAFLELENPQQPFEGGTTIKVRLIGKKFLDIRSLSGGEKTLTALAFIFSVQEHAPASFYILDEVDAALDKRNSEKLAELVKAYSSRAQYVMISHNDNVITSADNLYGISMNKDGTSKVTTLKI